jgi:hypothetical protein
VVAAVATQALARAAQLQAAMHDVCYVCSVTGVAGATISGCGSPGSAGVTNQQVGIDVDVKTSKNQKSVFILVLIWIFVFVFRY